MKDIPENAHLVKSNDKGFHILLDATKDCVAFGDIDHYKDKNKFNDFLDLLTHLFNVKLDDISYTISHKKDDNEYSYHWSIPSIKTNIQSLKNLFSDPKIKAEYDPDLSVYPNPNKTRWFRLPYQTNNDKPIQHVILKGKMEDFFVHYTKNASFEYNKEEEQEEEIEDEKPKTKSTYDEIKRYLLLLDDKRASEYEDWLKVAFLIKNELGEEGYDLFIEFSKRCPAKFHKLKNPQQFYRNIKKRDSRNVTIGTLKYMAKEDNPEEYEKIYQEKLIEEQQKKYPNMYEDVKKKFEETNFKIRNPVAFVELSKYDKNVLRDKKNLKDLYENLSYNALKENEETGEIKLVETKFIDEWLKDPKIRTYEKMDFRPCEKIPDDIYNTFDGFEISNKPLKPVEDITKTKVYEHLFNLCGREQQSLDYVLRYLANIVQQPYKKTQVALIFKSIQGCGKDTFFDWFAEKIIGKQYYFNSSKLDLIFGKFNSSLSKKILVVINEVNINKTKDIIENLKDATTAKVVRVEKKGKDTIEEQDNVHYILLTNNDNPLPIEHKDRRFGAFECNAEIAQNVEYFNALYKELYSGDIDRAFYDYLMSLDIKDYAFQDKRPKTQLYKTMKQRNIPPLALYMCSVVEENIKVYYALSFYENFQVWLNNNGYYEYKCTNTKFGIDIKVYPGIEKVRTQKGTEYQVDIEKLKAYLIKNEIYDEPQFIDK